MDLGPCPKTHSDRISKQFAEHLIAHPHDPRIAGYKQAHENHLYGFVEDCDRRIRASQRKLEKTPEENRKTVDLVSRPCLSFNSYKSPLQCLNFSSTSCFFSSLVLNTGLERNGMISWSGA